MYMSLMLLLAVPATLVLNGLQFDSTINVGNVITLFTIVVLGILGGSKLGNRVENIEKWIATHEKWIEMHEKEAGIRQDVAHKLEMGVELLNQSMGELSRRLSEQEFSANRERRGPHKDRKTG